MRLINRWLGLTLATWMFSLLLAQVAFAQSSQADEATDPGFSELAPRVADSKPRPCETSARIDGGIETRSNGTRLSVTYTRNEVPLVKVSHKLDIDEYEDRCIAAVDVVARVAGRGCELRMTFRGAPSRTGGLVLTKATLAADSFCPGWPDDFEGQYKWVPNSSEDVVRLLPTVDKVPDRTADRSCVDLTLKLAGSMRLVSSGRELTFDPSKLRVSGTFLSKGDTELRCPPQRASPSSAHPSVPKGIGAWARAQQNRAGLEYDLWPSRAEFFGVSVSTLAMGWTAYGQVALSDKVFLDFEVPWALVNVSISGDASSGVTASVDDETEGTFGNLTVGAHYADTFYALSRSNSFWVGGTVSIPPHGANDPGKGAIAGFYATLARGNFDAHRYIAKHMSLRLGGGVEARFIDDKLYLRVGLLPVFHIPFDGDFEFATEQGNEAEYRTDFGIGGGLRLQEVFVWTGSDKIQTALEPFVSYEAVGKGLTGRLGMLMALDERLGFGFDQGKVLTLRTTIGGKW
jgi:hypothetical protein